MKLIWRSTTIQKYFRKYLRDSGVTKKGLTIHSIRHCCATHLLESGADVRYVSKLLGHKSIETTVKYTHPLVEGQKKAYKMYHPRENGYFREINTNYMNRLEVLSKKFENREIIRNKIPGFKSL